MAFHLKPKEEKFFNLLDKDEAIAEILYYAYGS